MEQKPSNPNNKGITNFTILELLYGRDSLNGVSPVTPAIGDTAKVLVRSIELGRLIFSLDNRDEPLFHIEHCADNTREWCEIWLYREWKESNTRRSKIKEKSVKEREEHTKKSLRLKEIQELLTAGGLNQKPGFVEEMSQGILKCMAAEKYSEVLRIFKLTDLIAKYQEEDKQ